MPLGDRLRLVFAAAAIAAPLHARPQDPSQLIEDQRAVFALLDALDPFDTSPFPIVQCTIRIGDAPPVVVFGFLIEEDAEHFVVRDASLVVHDVARTFRNDAAHGSHTASNERALADAASEVMYGGEESVSSDGQEFHFPNKDVVPLFVVARDQARRGNLAEVHRIWGLLTDHRRAPLDKQGRPTAELALFFHERLLDALVDPRVSWEQLLAMHTAYITTLPDDFYARETRERNAKITGLLQERNRRAGARGAHPTIEDLVFDLHDECADQTFFNGFRADGPASKVVAAGLDAVPALIAVLDDHQGLTRCREQDLLHGRYWFPSMADLAERVLGEIAGWRPEGKDRKDAWRRWLADAQVSSRAAILEQRARALEPAAVATYASRHPERLERILDAIRASADGQRRHDATAALLRALDRPLPDAVLQFLADELAIDPAGPLPPEAANTSPAVRRWLREAAAALAAQNGTNAVAVAAKRWLDGVHDPAREIDADDTAAGARFLLQHLDDAAAADALTTGSSSPRGRCSLALALAAMPHARRSAIGTSPAGAAFRALLVRLIGDESIVTVGRSIGNGTKTAMLNTVAIADVAESTLASCWPAEFAFDPTKTASVRRRHRREPNAPLAQRDPALPANLVTSVTIHHSLLALPDESPRKLRALEGRELWADELHDAVVWTDLGAKDRRIAILVERTGLGDGTTIRVEPLDRGTSFSRSDVDGRGWVVTANGERESPAGSLTHEPSPIDDVRQALRRPATTGVEITVIVGGR